MNANAAVLYARWEDLPADHPLPLIARRRVIGQRMMVSHVSLARGFKVPSHHHDNEQITCILSGALRFGLGREGASDWRQVTVRAGDVIHLPSNTPHAAEALEDSVVLDLFSPPSERTGVDQPVDAHGSA